MAGSQRARDGLEADELAGGGEGEDGVGGEGGGGPGMEGGVGFRRQGGLGAQRPGDQGLRGQPGQQRSGAGLPGGGAALDNPVLRTEGRVTVTGGILACAVLPGLVLNAAAGWWQASPASWYVLVFYAAREVRDILAAITEPAGRPPPSAAC